jgi:glycosyltransferase involved in cell wall biosynthesis
MEADLPLGWALGDIAQAARDVRRRIRHGHRAGSARRRVDLLADAFLEAHRRNPRLHLVLAGGGPEEDVLRERLGAAVDRGGPASLIEHGETGLLAAPQVSALADAVGSLTSTPALSERIRRGGLKAVRERSWEAALDRLAAAYRIALSERADQRFERDVA